MMNTKQNCTNNCLESTRSRTYTQERRLIAYWTLCHCRILRKLFSKF